MENIETTRTMNRYLVISKRFISLRCSFNLIINNRNKIIADIEDASARPKKPRFKKKPKK